MLGRFETAKADAVRAMWPEPGAGTCLNTTFLGDSGDAEMASAISTRRLTPIAKALDSGFREFFVYARLSAAYATMPAESMRLGLLGRSSPPESRSSRSVDDRAYAELASRVREGVPKGKAAGGVTGARRRNDIHASRGSRHARSRRPARVALPRRFPPFRQMIAFPPT